MSTRLHRIGSIYSRIDGLLRKGQINETNKPIWFDVYTRFPPKYEPTFKRVAPDVKLREILYKEDALRAKIHKAFWGRLGIANLNSNRETRSRSMLKTCQQYISEGMSESEAIEKLEQVYGRKAETDISRNNEIEKQTQTDSERSHIQ